MVCPRCKTAGPLEAKFCLNCGGQLFASTPGGCAHCGTTLPPQAKFCWSCGSSANARSDTGLISHPAIS
ncbi:MAG: zinc ribbon domain-containing protein, partial [Bacteroidota bacterium]